MKKLLAMVLALVMTLSLAVSANAFKDDTKISDDYAEAVAVLNGMGVFKGYEDGSFKPEGNITRAEVATIIYRIYTADVAKNDKSGLYATYNKFSDMAGASWAAGYIGYCANAALVKGYPDGTFKPSGKVTGYEVLAMILRAVGYDKNNEFSGADWALHVAQTAQQLGVLDNVDKTTDLNAPASRELVAELLFQGIQKDQVTYTPAFGYVTDKVTGKANSSLGTKNFNLKSAADNDEWGRPAKTWTYTTGDTSTTFVSKPDVTYTVATKECDVASDLGLTAKTTYTTYINGVENKAAFTVEPTDTIGVLGAQGRLVEVYKDRIVMIDTYLAQVTGVTAATFDKAGHLDKYATLTLRVYDATTTNAASTGKTIVEYSKSDYSFAKGDFILLNAKTTAAYNSDVKTKSETVNGISRTVASYSELIGKAETVTGAQTSIIKNAKQHVVGGTNYNDANTYYLDEAQSTPFVNYTWFLDSYGNVIGSAKVASTYTYAILKDLVWNLGTPGSATATLVNAATGEVTTATVNAIDGDEDGAFDWDTAKATPVYAGTTSDVDSYKFSDKYAYVAPETFLVNSIYKGYALYRVEALSTGAVNLEGKDVIGYVADGFINNKATSLRDAAANKWLPVDDNTVFTVKAADATDKSGYSYTQYVGKNNVPNISGAVFFYIDANKDGVLDYVYVKSGNVDNSGKNFVVATSNTYYAKLYNNVENVWVLTEAMINGEVKQNTVTADAEQAAITLVTRVNGHFAPYYVTYAPDGHIASVTAFADSANGNGIETASGSGIYYAKLTNAGILANGLLVNGSSTFSLSSANVYGDYTKETLSTISDWTSVDVYAVWTQDALQLNGQYNRTISQLYVYNKGTNGSDGSGNYQGPATLSLTGVNKDLTATLTLPKVVGGTRVELQYRPYNSNADWAVYTASMTWTDGSINPYYYTATVSSLSGNYEFRAVAFNAAGTEIAVAPQIVPVYF